VGEASPAALSRLPACREPRPGDAGRDHLGALSEAVVSPDGRWIAGTGSAGPERPIARTAYALGVDAKKCLVVPGMSLGVAGFTSDSKAVIVERTAGDEPERRQFAIASLAAHCPREVAAKRVTTTGS
jgi:hypothetical protein